MVWNDLQFASEISTSELLSCDDEPWLHRIVPEMMPDIELVKAIANSPPEKAAVHDEATSGLKIRCDKQSGILEIIDPRMFRPEQKKFCQALINSAVSNGGASGVELELSAHLCRFQFDPDGCDEAELATGCALAIQAATRAVQPETSRFGEGQTKSALPDHATGTAEEAELLALTGSDRGRCLALGGGSLMLGIAGLILPGIPSAPFLLFSAHNFMQSSASFRLARWYTLAWRIRSQARGIGRNDPRSIVAGTEPRHRNLARPDVPVDPSAAPLGRGDRAGAYSVLGPPRDRRSRVSFRRDFEGLRVSRTHWPARFFRVSGSLLALPLGPLARLFADC